MKSYNESFKNGYNKIKQKVDDSKFFRKSYNTLDQINKFALPVLSAASVIAPQLSPAIATVGAALRGSQNLAGALKNSRN
jgi:hypothetical protein